MTDAKDTRGCATTKRFKVSVFPVYDESPLDARTGDLCAFADHQQLEAAMCNAGRMTQLWLDAPAEHDDPEGKPPVRFEVVVEVPK